MQGSSFCLRKVRGTTFLCFPSHSSPHCFQSSSNPQVHFAEGTILFNGLNTTCASSACQPEYVQKMSVRFENDTLVSSISWLADKRVFFIAIGQLWGSMISSATALSEVEDEAFN